MRTLHVLYQLQRADFLERIRRNSFLVILGLSVLVGYLIVPDDNASYTILRVSGYRGIYNSAWIGVMVALAASTFLSLTGFLIVKNAIARDNETGVGQIIAGTPVKKIIYLLGKFLSNLSVLSLIVGVLAAMSVVMQFLRGESGKLDLFQLLLPLLLITLPAMALVSAFALLFESITWLRGGFGNLVWFFMWISFVIWGTTSSADPLGTGSIISQITHDASKHLGKEAVGITLVSSALSAENGVFPWVGLDWSTILPFRLFWTGIALLLICLTSLFFNRFDKNSIKKGLQKNSPSSATRTDTADSSNQEVPVKLTAPVFRFSFTVMVMYEIRLFIKGIRWWWYIAAAALAASPLLMLPDGDFYIIASISWLWPVVIWSSTGCREINGRVEELIFSCPRLLYRQLAAHYTAGFIVALLTGSGVILGMAVTGNRQGMLSMLVGALFIPSLALVLGIWSRSGKLFILVFMALFWYMGLLNGLPLFDFAGLHGTGTGHTLAYFLFALLLCVLSIWGRRKQLHK